MREEFVRFLVLITDSLMLTQCASHVSLERDCRILHLLQGLKMVDC